MPATARPREPTDRKGQREPPRCQISAASGSGASKDRCGASSGWSEDRYRIDGLTQISAVQAALDKVAPGLLDDHARHCVIEGHGEGEPEELIAAGARLIRRGESASGRGNPSAGTPGQQTPDHARGEERGQTEKGNRPPAQHTVVAGCAHHSRSHPFIADAVPVGGAYVPPATVSHPAPRR